MQLRQSPGRVRPALHPDGLRGVHGGSGGVAIGGGGHGGEPSKKREKTFFLAGMVTSAAIFLRYFE